MSTKDTAIGRALTVMRRIKRAKMTVKQGAREIETLLHQADREGYARAARETEEARRNRYVDDSAP